MTNITIPSSVTDIGDRAFENTGLSSVTIPSSVQNGGAYIFAGCSNLQTVTVNCSDVFEGMFAECSNLQTVNLSNSVTYIASGAFYNTGLSSVTIPSSVQYIDTYAFWECYDLQTVTVEAMTPPTLGSDVFWLDNLQEIRVPQAALADYQNSDWGSYYGSYLVGY